MKKILLFTLLFASTLAFSQFTLEHTYTDGSVNRIKLDYSGEKYVVFNNTSKQLRFYNADHTFWKSITLTMPAGGTLISFDQISQAVINPDENIEVAYSYYYSSNGDSIYVCKVISEDGTELLSVDGYSPEVSTIGGLQSKLIIKKFNGLNDVYSLPGLVLEHSFPQGRLTRTKLEVSGEKYYLYDLVNDALQFYNADYSFWKTVAAPAPDGYSFYVVGAVSETAIVPDAQIEIAYSYEKNLGNGNGFAFGARVVNEAGTILLSVPDAGNIYLSQIAGLENKIGAIKVVAGVATTDIFQTPSLGLEHSYDGIATRTKLDVSGEKYYTPPTPDHELMIYNADHSLWKTVNLPAASPYNLISSVSGLSERKLNDDNLLEVMYTTYYVLGDIAYFYQSRIANELGTVLLNVPDFSNIYLSEIEGAENKVIANGGEPVDGVNGGGQVYLIDGALNSPQFRQTPFGLSPNPASGSVAVDAPIPVVCARMYTMTGMLVSTTNSRRIEKINVSALESGMYLAVLTDVTGVQTTRKVIVAH